ncbi:hypothetical protein ACFOKI_07765 [Sphingomonas qilianensis]|uniref:Uncharacterized protein n=1 Tax=Sphingomonas qilianensis TaxID=1736690 RepID=A0ABU9XWR5_9SPHN
MALPAPHLGRSRRIEQLASDLHGLAFDVAKPLRCVTGQIA